MAVPEVCPVCKAPMLYDDGREAYVCNCGFAEPSGPTEEDLERVAATIAAKVSDPEPEPDPVMSCSAQLQLSVDFTGSVAQPALMKKLRLELMAAVRSAVSITSRELRLKVADVSLDPVEVFAETKGGSDR